MENISERFPQVEALENFKVFDPTTFPHDQDDEYGFTELEGLAKRFRKLDETQIVNEWERFSVRLKSNDFKVF